MIINNVHDVFSSSGTRCADYDATVYPPDGPSFTLASNKYGDDPPVGWGFVHGGDGGRFYGTDRFGSGDPYWSPGPGEEPNNVSYMDGAWWTPPSSSSAENGGSVQWIPNPGARSTPKITARLVYSCRNGLQVSNHIDPDGPLVSYYLGDSKMGEEYFPLFQNSRGAVLVTDEESVFYANNVNGAFSILADAPFEIDDVWGFNAAQIAVADAQGNMNQVDAPQLVGTDSDYGQTHFVYEENPLSQVYVEKDVNAMILPNSYSPIIASAAGRSHGNSANQMPSVEADWEIIAITGINDFGVLIGQAIAKSDGQIHSVVLPVIDVCEDTNNNFKADPSDKALTYVKFGLWDWAFDGDPVTVLNDNPEVRNFVGSDSRRFYLRIADPSGNTNKTTIDKITVHWFTQQPDGSDQDHPGTDTITLTETGINTGIFVSKALMLVADNVDNSQTTDTGLVTDTGAPAGIKAGIGTADHRLRMATIDDHVCVSYTPAANGAKEIRLTLPIFGPTERKQMTVHAFNFSGGTPNAGKIDDAVVIEQLQHTKDRYAVAGVKVNTIYDPLKDTVVIPEDRKINLNKVDTQIFIAQPDPSGRNTLVPSPMEEFLIRRIRNKSGGVDPQNNSNANVIYLLFVGSLNEARGESFPSAYAVPTIASNVVFVSGRGYGVANIANVSPHEVGHLLLNRAIDDVRPVTDGGHYFGFQNDQNLMRSGTLDSNPARDTDSRRLWDDSNHQLQISYLRGSPLLKNY